MIDYEVRDGKRVWPTCISCGCRLGVFEDMWYHYLGAEDGIDAQGHPCPKLHDGIELPQ